MSDSESKNKKRVTFITPDIHLLLDCVKNESKILENKETNKITPDMKRKVNILQIFFPEQIIKTFLIFQAWERVLTAFNAGQTGGIKTLKNIQDKYKNEKKNAKQRLSANKVEMNKTGGGSYEMKDEDNFGFSSKQIVGFNNKFDSDSVDLCKNDDDAMQKYNFKEIGENSENDMSSFNATPVRKLPVEPMPKYSNKKMKMSKVKDEFYDSKLESIKLDNDYKKLLIKKTQLENVKLEMEIETLQNKMNQNVE